MYATPAVFNRLVCIPSSKKEKSPGTNLDSLFGEKIDSDTSKRDGKPPTPKYDDGQSPKLRRAIGGTKEGLYSQSYKTGGAQGAGRKDRLSAGHKKMTRQSSTLSNGSNVSPNRLPSKPQQKNKRKASCCFCTNARSPLKTRTRQEPC